MSEESGEAIYSYSSGSEMIPVRMGLDVGVSCGMKAVTSGDVFAGPDEESFKYTVIGYGIGTSISRSGAMDV